MELYLGNLGRNRTSAHGMGRFGLEKESLRVDANGYLAQTKHPFGSDQQRTRDFCENQVELITDVQGSISEVWEALAKLHRRTVRELGTMEEGPEYLWPFSNPPYVRSDEDIPVACYSEQEADEEVYSNYLTKKYGKKQMMFSGIHFNFSYREEWLAKHWKYSCIVTFEEYKNRRYLDLAAKSLQYSWLIVYLTAASPIVDGSFTSYEELGRSVPSGYASLRCSESGFWNSFVPVVDYASLEAYTESVCRYVNERRLWQASELYWPVRLKMTGNPEPSLWPMAGIDHIEYRMLDLNPLAEIGVDQRDLEFLFQLIVYLSLLPETVCTEPEQHLAIQNMKAAAGSEDAGIRIGGEDGRTVSVREAARAVLDHMEMVLPGYLDPQAIRSCLQYQRQKVLNPRLRYAAQVTEQFGADYVRRGMALIKQRNEMTAF